MHDHEEHEHHVGMFRMEAEANTHETRQFFEGLSEEQLKKLYGLLHMVIGTDGMAGSYYQGIIAMRLDQKFGVCMACGVKHEEELASMMPPVPEPRPDPIRGPAKGTAEYNSLMALYGLEQDDDGSDRVMCKNCKTWYIDLADRMRRPVAGCTGCIQKEKWG